MPRMSEEHKQIIRQDAQEFIAGTRREMHGPESGHMLLWFLATIEEWEAYTEEWEAQRAEIRTMCEERDARLAALAIDVEELRDLMERQRQTIEALEAENAALRLALGHDEEPPSDQGDLRW